MRTRDKTDVCAGCGRGCRGQLCWKCHSQRPQKPSTADETDEALDRIIAEQMQCLPDWWDSENEDEVMLRIGKLTPDERRMIRRIYRPGHPKRNAYALARRFGVSRSTIWSLVHSLPSNHSREKAHARGRS